MHKNLTVCTKTWLNSFENTNEIVSFPDYISGVGKDIKSFTESVLLGVQISTCHQIVKPE